MNNVFNKQKVLTQCATRIRISFCDKSNNLENTKIPAEPTNCCMSGCANCVWIEYAESLTKLFNDGGERAQKIILENISDPNMKAFLSTELRIMAMKAKDLNLPKK